MVINFFLALSNAKNSFNSLSLLRKMKIKFFESQILEMKIKTNVSFKCSEFDFKNHGQVFISSLCAKDTIS